MNSFTPYISFTLLFFAVLTANAQSFKFDHFDDQDGMNQRFVYSIDQDQNGYLVIGTGEGVYLYDGFNFDVKFENDGLAEDFATCSFTDKSGNIWFGHYGGGVTRYDGETFQPVPLVEGITSKITDITQDDDGNIWIVTQNEGIIKLDDSGPIQFQGDLEGFLLYSMKIDHVGRFFVGTDIGLVWFKVEDNKMTNFEFSDDITESQVTCIEWSRDSTSFLIGAEDEGIFKMFLNAELDKTFRISTNELDFADKSVNHILEDEAGDLWVSTNNAGIFQLSDRSGTNYSRVIDLNEDDLIGSKSIQCSFKDAEGNLWIGTKGHGLIRQVDEYFSFFNIGKEKNEESVHSILPNSKGLWLGTNKRIILTGENPNHILQSYDESKGLPEGVYNSIYRDVENTLWVGSDGEGLFYFDEKNDRFLEFDLAQDLLNKRVNHISGAGNIVYVATDFGLYQIKNKKVISHLTMQSGLPHNVVKTLYHDSSKRIWVGTHNNAFTYIEDGVIRSIKAPEAANLVDVLSFNEDFNGALWIGTDGGGLIMINKGKSKVYTKTDGLLSDFCYSLITDRENRIWIGHRGGMSRLDPTTGDITIFDNSSLGNVDFQENAACMGNYGILWFGSSDYLLKYDLEKDIRNTVEPKLNITDLVISDSLYQNTDLINLDYGDYKLNIDFVGISLKQSDQVQYQYMLEGYDSDWSNPTQDKSAYYSRLSSGSYVFKVRAFNGDGFGGETVKSFDIFIDKPFWMKWWFFALTSAFVFLAVRYVVKRREKMMIANQELLQFKLDERTKEVVAQKELLEHKNKDITDSIIYAKNIQKAMLPAPDSLDNFFMESFVFFKPRDIVSGDFYWVEKFGSKVIIACADCTGHGVPGAFMSLIGTVILKDVTRLNDVAAPNHALQLLDEELKSMLHKKDGSYSVDDGMDISIVEFDIDTKVLRAASAKRPIILYINGERVEIKGDRSPIGGNHEKYDKDFALHEFQLSEGDVFYQFSDGFADQFGGERGKKLKRKGLMNILDEVFNMNMEAQRRLVRQKFFEWKGDFAQVDDIIMLGIRV